jgi:methionyl-tRNA formyltransferase
MINIDLNKKSNLNLVFIGSDEFAASVLNKLIELNYNILLIIAKSDLIKRKKVVTSKLKEIAIENNLDIIQSKTFNQKEIIQKLSNLKIDLIIVCSYGLIIPSAILNQYLTINIHPSLLPLLRGASPIQTAILKNFKETGISIIKMTNKLDQGPIYVQGKVNIDWTDTYFSLKKKLLNLVFKIFESNYLSLIKSMKLKAYEQNENKATYSFKISSETEKINWNDKAINIYNKIRALYDQPVAYTIHNQQRYKIYFSEINSVNSDVNLKNVPGTITKINQKGIFVQTFDQEIIIKKIKAAGRKNIIEANNYTGYPEGSLKTERKFN